jgi:cytoskeletal protein RodZ
MRVRSTIAVITGAAALAGAGLATGELTTGEADQAATEASGPVAERAESRERIQTFSHREADPKPAKKTSKKQEVPRAEPVKTATATTATAPTTAVATEQQQPQATNTNSTAQTNTSDLARRLETDDGGEGYRTADGDYSSAEVYGNEATEAD